MLHVNYISNPRVGNRTLRYSMNFELMPIIDMNSENWLHFKFNDDHRPFILDNREVTCRLKRTDGIVIHEALIAAESDSPGVGSFNVGPAALSSQSPGFCHLNFTYKDELGREIGMRAPNKKFKIACRLI